MNNTKAKGVRDLMWQHRYQWKHISMEMVSNGVPGNWDKAQNIYNLVNGSIIPKDAYIYIVLARMFNTDVTTILGRYTSVNTVDNALSKEVLFSEPLFNSSSKLNEVDEDSLF